MKHRTWIAIIGFALSILFSTAASAQEQARALPANAVIEMVNINTADVKTLSTLPGIGVKKAESIIAYRELNGEFSSVEELANVKGIGKRMVEKLATRVSL